MTAKWDGITSSEVLRDDEVVIRHALADAAKQYNWKKTQFILDERPDLINVTRPDGRSLYTPLHQAAHGNAPMEVVQQMVEIGAWRTLRNTDDERAVDIAKRKGHQCLVQLLEPVYKTHISHTTLHKIQIHFHEIILGRAGDLVKKFRLRLPELEPLLEIEQPRMWFPVPGMYGGFSYWLDGEGKNAKLISESWCRVVGGSGQRHEITSREGKLVDKGFV
ncbi:ankyrin repeat domain-containing protein [Phormidium sp. LEGE 05292]|uniref:ankyrin repeat domain-containing protein n=1 Tax=[Phormidium] sp. LEGE 05292 TaxID=767427 RepID=UPI00187FF4F7|nr:ankyrin repeat domain-containing protein [Phormidium sp. LEGE 05292]MBE9229766.1 ankyrin repeat domain-containing protein [Phormidium sp. LEGE 05292]